MPARPVDRRGGVPRPPRRSASVRAGRSHLPISAETSAGGIVVDVRDGIPYAALITVDGDPDHEAEEAAWVPLRDVSRQLAYPNERRIVRIALDLLYRDGRD